MPSQKNITALSAVSDKIKKSKSVVLSHYTGLTMKEQTALRAEVKSVDAEMVVVKNTLLKRAMGTDQLDSALTGQTAAILSYGDEVAGIKKVVEFAKKVEKLEIIAGWMNNAVLSVEEIKALAKLPSKLELIATVISRLKGPSYGMVNVLAGPTRKLVYALEAIRKQKESSSQTK